jgi:hypothetical protein
MAERFGRQTDHLDINNIIKEESERKRKTEEQKSLIEKQF